MTRGTKDAPRSSPVETSRPPDPAELPAGFLDNVGPGSDLGPEPPPYVAEPQGSSNHVAAEVKGASAPPRGQDETTEGRAGESRPTIKKPKAEPDPGSHLAPLPAAPALDAPPGIEDPPGAPLTTAPSPLGPSSDPAVEKSQAVGTLPATGSRPEESAPPTLPPPPTPTPTEGSPLPSASASTGQNPVARGDGSVPSTTPTAPTRESEPSYVLPADRLPLGRQSVGLTVEVVGPQFLNINQTAALKIVVKNTGAADAIGVVVRDEMPENLEYLSSQPEAHRIERLLSWNLGTVSAGSERIITLSVKPTKVGAFDHAATVSMVAGGRSRSLVREPKLKVEQTVNSGKILRGQPVEFKIAVSNPGDGPARKVLVQAQLSPGLRHESGEPNEQNLFEQTIDVIGPGERVVLATLVADTVLGGEQWGRIAVKSPDVLPGSADATNTQTVIVTEPKLTLAINGPKDRYTDTLGDYEIALENPGSAPARNVRVLVTLPVSGRLFTVPAGAQFDKQTRRLTWSRPRIEPGEKAVLSFQLRMGGIGLYQVAAETRAEGALLAKGTISTDVTGLADVDFDVTEKRRAVDVNGVTVYTIKVVNTGTKEATKLLLSAELSKNVEPIDTGGTDTKANWNKDDNKVIFPAIERLGPNKSVELAIRVKATKPGIATCRVFLLHDDLTEKLEDMAAFKVMPIRR
ncbi:MAG: hypothetical protein NVSMB9_11870 [Isosphaeraceae bacterium]